METGAEILSIETIKKDEYKRFGELYRPLFSEQRQQTETHLPLSAETSHMVGTLPEDDRGRVVDFTRRVTAAIPEDVFTQSDYLPDSREGVKALIALSYVHDKEAHSNPKIHEMYIRALSALSPDSLYFSNNYDTNTEKISQDFFEKSDISLGNLANYLAQIVASAMPLSSKWTDLSESKSDYDKFIDKASARYKQAMEVFIDYCKKYAPDRVADATHWEDNIVFVGTISRLPVFTNDPRYEDSANYNVLAAGAVAFGIDKISGLPLSVSHLPYNFDAVAENPELKSKDDPVFTNTLTLVHESLHNLALDKELKGDFIHLVNEMLTDTSAWMVVLQSRGINFLTVPGSELPFTGYFDLMLLGRSLMVNGFFSQEEMVQFGMEQNPYKFLEVFTQRVTQCQDGQRIENVINSMQSRLLIKPRKEAEVPVLMEQFKANPAAFMESEFMDMWRITKGQYMGMKMYPLAILYIYRENHPEIGEENYTATRNNKGALNDEAVELFYEYWKGDETYRYLLLSQDKLIQVMNETSTNFNLDNLDLPDDLKIPADDSLRVMNLLRSTNTILSAGLDYHVGNWSDEQRFQAIIETSRDIYQGVVKVLEANWGENGIRYTSNEVLRLLEDVAPKWFSWNSAVSEPRQVVAKVLAGVEAITSPVQTPNGPSVPGPDQVLYWGPALEITE